MLASDGVGGGVDGDTAGGGSASGKLVGNQLAKVMNLRNASSVSTVYNTCKPIVTYSSSIL